MPQCLNAEEAKEFRDFFRDSGYTTQALQKRFGAAGIRQLDLLKLYLLGILLEPSRLTTLFRWFWIGVPVETVTAAELIPERMISLFLKAGVLATKDGSLVSTARVSSFAENWNLASGYDPLAQPRYADLLSPVYSDPRRPHARPRHRQWNSGSGGGIAQR